MNENIKYFLYVRKSQESDERQVQSIDDQLKVMHEKAKSLGIEIVEVFTESMSAKAPGRYRFNEMIQRIKNKEASGIIAWKLDRLSRNPIDSGSIQYMLQMGELLKIVTNDKEYTIVDSGLLMSVENGMSNQFLLDLSKNVKRGLSSKLDKGWWPGPAPEGYKNDREYNTIVPGENFVLLRKIWDLMLSGKYTIVQILDIANNQLGFRTSKIKNKGGKKIGKSGIYFIFNNLFYTGNFERKGKIYKGSHPPMITIDEFQRVQSLFQEKRKPKLQKHHFSFTGVMVCGACGSMVTAGNKKKINKITNEEKIYNYYWCTRTKDSKCKQRVISSDELEKQYNEILGSIQISEEFKVWALDIIKNNLKNEMGNMDEIKRRLNNNEFQQKKKLDGLIDLLVDGTIDKPTYNLKKELFEKELLNIKQEIEGLENKSKLIIGNAEEILDFSLNAQNMFKIGDSSTKRVIAKNLGLHSVLYNKNLYVKLEKWFEVIKDNANGIGTKNAPIAPIVKGTSNGLLVPSDCIIPIWQDLQIQTTNGKLDWKNYARVFPQVPAEKKLYEKIPLKEGKIGINIVGEKLFPPPPNDVDIFKLCSEGVVYLKENNREYIVSSQSGYVQPLIGNYDSKQYGEKQGKKVKVSIEQILQPVAVNRQIELGNVGPKTGNIHATGDICITRGITHDYWVKAENTQCIGDVSGSIYAKKDIQITGNIIGGTSHYSSIKNETSGENGQVFSENGNVFIQGKVFSHSLIHAQKGNLTATFGESSVFIGDNIVLQSAHSCIIIGKNIQIDNVVNSIIICVGRIFIKSLISHKEAGNIIFIIKPKDFKKEVEKMSLQITKLKQNTQEILQVIQQLEHRNKEIQSDPKALEIIALRKKKELTLSEKNTLVQNMQRFTSQVRELQNNNTNLSLLADKVKKQAEELEKLSEVFEKISHIQEKTLTPELRILLHQSKTKLAYLQIPDFEDFSSLSKEVLSQLADYRDIIQNNTFPTELIQELQEGSDINWQHQ